MSGSLLAEATKPTLAPSVWNSFRFVSGIVFFGAWVISQPVVMLTHRRIGKKIINPIVGAISLTVLISFAAVSVQALNYKGPSFGGGNPSRTPGYYRPPPRDAISSFLFGGLVLASIAAWGCHQLASRRRFGTSGQTHSLDFGIPTLCYPFGIRIEPAADGAGEPFNTEGSDTPPLYENKTLLRRLGGYPGVMLRGFETHLKEHAGKIKRGEIPYGPIAWFTASTIEPALLVVASGLLILLLNAWAFGIYLALVAVALAIKTSIIAADWRERIYSEVDQRLEIEAMKGIREGKSMSAISAAFTVPVHKAVLASGREVAPAGGVPKGFENLFRTTGNAGS